LEQAAATEAAAMSVYVDRASHAFGRMTMCHLIADTRDELLAMVDLIGVARRWIQHENLPTEHFDICQSKRALAVKAGAAEVTGRQLVEVIRRKRNRGQ
jgi:hypothetical protein